MWKLLGKLSSKVVPRSVVPIADMLSLDFSSTKHQFRRFRKGFFPGNPQNLLFAVSTYEYHDILGVTASVAAEVKKDLDLSPAELITMMVSHNQKQSDTFTLISSEVIPGKKSGEFLGALIHGKSVSDDSEREIIYCGIPLRLKHKSDSFVWIKAIFPSDSPKSLKEDLIGIVKSVDIHSDR